MRWIFNFSVSEEGRAFTKWIWSFCFLRRAVFFEDEEEDIFPSQRGALLD